MKKELVAKIIRSFYGKQFTAHFHLLFAQWLRADNDKMEKEKLFEELWSEIGATRIPLTPYLQEDWEKIHNRISQPVASRKSLFLYSWRQCIAVFLLMFASSCVTYIIMQKGLKNTETVHWVEFQVPYGESQSVLLPDGSRVSINPGSILIYPEEFTSNDRSVFLTGEACFTVAPNKEKTFYVQTKDLKVEALGTVFTVKSYPGDLITSAILEEGSVGVSIHSGTFEIKILKPGEQLLYFRTDQTVSVEAVDMHLYRMERKGYLIFKDASFSELVTGLERKYNVVINYDGERFRNRKCNLKFAPNESLEEVMEVIRKLIHIHYKIEGNVIYIN